MGGIPGDVRYAWRMFVKSPGFAVVAVLTLALGIGANTAIFSLVHTVLLQPIPYTDADKLISVLQYDTRSGTSGVSLSLPKFKVIAEQSQTLQSAGVYYLREMSMVTPHEPEVVSAARVSATSSASVP